MSTKKSYEDFQKLYDHDAFLTQESEYQLFVFWKKPKGSEAELLKQIADQFVIQEVFHLRWSKEKIVENFQRFYAMTEGHAYHKFTRSGVMPFLLVVVKDENPTYEYRLSGGSGFKFVNKKAFDLKQNLRRQKGISLHATNDHRSFEET